jgi:hypothetical protein
MIHGFNVDDKLICEGIIGDGCGGGRFFIIEEGTLKAYDPQSKEVIVLLEDIRLPKSIRKKTCTLFIECENESFEFDLPTMTKRNPL